jgi:hypothetical protein
MDFNYSAIATSHFSHYVVLFSVYSTIIMCLGLCLLLPLSLLILVLAPEKSNFWFWVSYLLKKVSVLSIWFNVFLYSSTLFLFCISLFVKDWPSWPIMSVFIQMVLIFCVVWAVFYVLSMIFYGILGLFGIATISFKQVIKEVKQL